MVVAPDGAVSIFGGRDENGPLADVEKYDPETNQYSVVGRLQEARCHFAAVSFGDDRVALVGGKGREQFGMPDYPFLP